MYKLDLSTYFVIVFESLFRSGTSGTKCKPRILEFVNKNLNNVIVMTVYEYSSSSVCC